MTGLNSFGDMVKLLNDAKINARTRANLTEVERLAGVSLTIIKGQKIDKGDSSAGTHDGFGVVDIRTSGWSAVTRNSVLLALRVTGNAAWYRTVAQGFDGPHIHAVLMGEPTLSPPARRQVTAYRNGRNGLANNGPDDGPDGFTRVTWESYLKAHQIPEDEMPLNDADKKFITDAAEKASHRWAIWGQLYRVETADEFAAAQTTFENAIDAGKTPEEAAQLASGKVSELRAALKKSQAEL